MRNEFVAVIKEHEGIIFKITKIYADDHEDQQDLFQEIVYQLWKSFASFKGNAKISTWIYRVALNTSIAHINRKKKLLKRVPLEGILLNLSEENDAVMEEKIALLYFQIKQLNEVEKALILLFLEGKSYEEIAGITGFTPSNVGTRLSRIKQKLKSQII